MWKREPYTVTDATFFGLGTFVALVSYAAVIASYHALPEMVPVHYGFTGTPDAYAPKGFFSVFGLMFIHFGISVLLLWLHAHPQYANIPGRVPLMKLRQPYKRSVEWIVQHMSVMMFVLMSLIFSYITLNDIVVGMGFVESLNQLPIIGLLLILVVLNIVYITMIFRITSLAARRKKLPGGW